MAITMEELLASQTKKLITLHRGQQVEGQVVAVTEKEIILDLGAKSEGVLQRKELTDEAVKVLKSGDKFKVFVSLTENENGQVIVSIEKQIPLRFMNDSRNLHGRGNRSDWNKFTSAQSQKKKLQATVLEINKGGLIVEVDGTRGFLPNSQVGFELMSKSSTAAVLDKSGQGLDKSSTAAVLDKLIGQSLSLTVIEVDSNNNKLIFTQRGQVSDEVKNKLNEFKNNQKCKGKIVAVLPFGLVVDISGCEGLVFIADVAWEKIEDLTKIFSTGQEIEVVVIGIDHDLGRLNLSIKQLSEDPFSKLVKQYPADEVVKAAVSSVSDTGIYFKLADGLEGFMSLSKVDPATKYEAGKSVTVLVDSIDAARRRINLAPFITSTEGLIYK